jgi:hypothetical protein
MTISSLLGTEMHHCYIGAERANYGRRGAIAAPRLAHCINIQFVVPNYPRPDSGGRQWPAEAGSMSARCSLASVDGAGSWQIAKEANQP